MKNGGKIVNPFSKSFQPIPLAKKDDKQKIGKLVNKDRVAYLLQEINSLKKELKETKMTNEECIEKIVSLKENVQKFREKNELFETNKN